MLVALLVGLVLSFVGSMPIAGPIAVLVMSKGLDNKAHSALFVAIGAAFAEATYAGLAFLGLTAMLERYPLLLPISRVFGCVILIALGAYFIQRKTKKAEELHDAPKADPTTTAVRSTFLGLSITALNPTLIVTWTAAVSAAHGAGLLRVNELDAIPFAAGVLSGIIGWFATFLWLLTRFRKRLQPESLDRAIKWMGVVLVLAGSGFGVRTVMLWVR